MGKLIRISEQKFRSFERGRSPSKRGQMGGQTIAKSENKSAHILLFTGVRYERHNENISPLKHINNSSNKKHNNKRGKKRG